MGVLKSFFDLTSMDDAVNEMVTAMDTLSPVAFHEKVQGLSLPARFLAKHTIQAELNSQTDDLDRAGKLQQVLNELESV